MSNSRALLVEAASAVAALGACQRDFSLLDDASLIEGMRLVRELDGQAQSYKLWMSAEIARRSDYTLGYDGLARKNGSATPAIFIQAMTGSSIEEANRLARLGQSMVDYAGPADGFEPGRVSPAVQAAVSGELSLDAADAIRRGLGQPDDSVTAAQLATAADELVARAGAMTPEALLKAARRARNELDLDAIERGEKQRSATRYVRTWSRDGMSGGSWALPDEDGGLEIRNALKLLVATKTNGPRFVDITRRTPGADISNSPETADDPEDDRSPEHIMADGFVQIFHNGLTADPSVVPGAGRAPVRVIVPEHVLTDRANNGPDSKPSGSALLEESMSAISIGKLGEFLCEGGTIGILFTENGQILDAGREQRLFTRTQRAALGVRDGGCRYPGCDKPPSWCEAHHIDYWARDNGTTDVANGTPFSAKGTSVKI
ncbi:MAG TPA: DUF222 domain-containing protein [Galbitalea sp.]|jgi:hypothetical protein|nr:DUF222 domain-containing protein [Galbitalea sp.]